MKRKAYILFAALTVLGNIPFAAAEPRYSKAASAQAVPATGKPDVFGSVALPVSRSRYDARWNRVARTSPAGGALPSFVQTARSLAPTQQAQMVNAAMNQSIQYQFDAPGDRWATARETVGQMAGDCEDIAIAKMQALIALGVPASDLFMSIGSDTAAGAVHAVLLLKMQGRFWVLDNRVNRLIPHEGFRQFHPILTFSGSRTWLHGYREGTMPFAVKTLSIAVATGKLQVGGAGSSPAARARS